MGGIVKSVTKLVSSVLGSPDVPKPPKPAPVVPMADEKAANDARRRALQAAKNRTSRDSTVLSDSDTFGG